jgi:hypothetical protein
MRPKLQESRCIGLDTPLLAAGSFNIPSAESAEEESGFLRVILCLKAILDWH